MQNRAKLIELLQAKYDHYCDQCGVNKDSGYTENLADYLIANGVVIPDSETPRWIPVEEGLPTQDDYEKYLREYGEYNYYLVMIKGAISPTVLMFDGEHWFDVADVYDVTHWMPLPNPPKGE